MEKNKGYSLLELLVVIVLISLLGIGIMSAYYGLLKSERKERLLIKSEADVQALLGQLKKIFSAIGYGVPIDCFNPTMSCPERVISYNGTELRFLSTFVRQNKYAGCWWVCGMGNFTTTAKTRFANDCPASPNEISTSDRWFLVMDRDRSIKSFGTDIVNCQIQGDVIVYLGKKGSSNAIFPEDFITRIYLDSTNLPSECASETKTLYIQVGDDTPQPLISCVGDLRVRYIDENGNYSDNLELSTLWGLRLCLLIQIGGRRDSQEDLPQYSDLEKCGNLPPNDTWKYYRWRVIEEDIPLYNLINWGQ
jgi:type IV pilus assembly protein PilW